MTEDAKAYYAGGYRVTQKGVPCKVFNRLPWEYKSWKTLCKQR